MYLVNTMRYPLTGATEHGFTWHSSDHRPAGVPVRAAAA